MSAATDRSIGLPANTGKQYGYAAHSGDDNEGADLPGALQISPSTSLPVEPLDAGTEATGVSPLTGGAKVLGYLSSLFSLAFNGTFKVQQGALNGNTDSTTSAAIWVTPATNSQALTAGVALPVTFSTDIKYLRLVNKSGFDVYWSAIAGQPASTATEWLPAGSYFEGPVQVAQGSGISVFTNASGISTNAAGGITVTGGHF